MKYLQKIISFLSSSRGKEKHVSPSTSLMKIMGKKAFTELVLETPDRRKLVANAARKLGLAEEELIAELAKRSCLPYILHVQPMDLAALPSGLRIGDFRKAGAIGITAGNSLTGIICVDPALITHLFASQIKVPLYLAPWKHISSALEYTEKEYLEKQEAEKAARQKNLEDAAYKVFQLILDEATEKSACEVLFLFGEGKVEYEYSVSEASGTSVARGEVSSVISEQLYSFLLSGEEKRKEDSALFWNGVQQCIGLVSEVLVPHRRIRVRVEQQKSVAPKEVVPELPSSDRVIEFPIAASRGSSNEEKKEEPSDDCPKTILLVDDNETFAKVLERFLKKENIETVWKRNGREALDALKNGEVNPQLIVCDVHMPTMNGIEFVRSVRGEDADLIGPALIMLTSDEDVEMEIRLLELGANAFLKKSQDPRLLSVHVKRLLSHEARRAA